MPWMLDLCSGLGGASQAFVNDPAWQVVRIENNPLLSEIPYTHNYDILEWMDWLPEIISDLGRPDLLWASVPCLEFSNAYHAPQSIARREGIHFEPDMSILEACIDIEEYCRPTFAIYENVRGACPWFLPYLGKHMQKIGPFFLWGRFPHLLVSLGDVADHRGKAEMWGIDDPLRANKRALIPLFISESVIDAICAQSTLSEWA